MKLYFYLFLLLSPSRNNTVVETHLGADVRLHCRITRNSEYGMVSTLYSTGDPPRRRRQATLQDHQEHSEYGMVSTLYSTGDSARRQRQDTLQNHQELRIWHGKYTVQYRRPTSAPIQATLQDHQELRRRHGK